jgi:nitrogen regulatory protein P-II 1
LRLGPGVDGQSQCQDCKPEVATVKLIKCIVREDRVDEATDALRQIDVSGVTVTPVLGRGRRKIPKGIYRGSEYEIRHTRQMMIDVVVADWLVDDVVRVVMEAARTGRRGDGRVFVIPVEEAYTIRTRAGGPD